ncbi:MAG: DUF1127 domain-containing protein [Sneathiella sp.]
MNVLTPTQSVVTEGIQRTASSLVSAFEKLTTAVQSYLRYRQTVIALSALDARELADIGLVRADIDAIAKGQKH